MSSTPEFLDLSDRILSLPHAGKALVGNGTRIIKWGRDPDNCQNSWSPTWQIYDEKTRLSCDSHHSVSTRGLLVWENSLGKWIGAKARGRCAAARVVCAAKGPF